MKHPNSLKALEIKEKAAVLPTAVCIGDPNEIRTRVTAVRGRCPRPLDDGTASIPLLSTLFFLLWQVFFS